jgi:Flp pilus assembly protein TadD
LIIQPTAKGMSPGDDLDAAQRETRLRHIVQQAVQLRANGNFQDTVRLLREATVLDPRNSDLHRELGITFLLTHDWERARVEMLEAVHLDPGNTEAHSGLAYAYEKLGDLEEALKEYRICTHLDSTDASYQRHYLEVLGEFSVQQTQHKH